jgi:hypothetical protein
VFGREVLILTTLTYHKSNMTDPFCTSIYLELLHLYSYYVEYASLFRPVSAHPTLPVAEYGFPFLNTSHPYLLSTSSTRSGSLVRLSVREICGVGAILRGGADEAEPIGKRRRHDLPS